MKAILRALVLCSMVSSQAFARLPNEGATDPNVQELETSLSNYFENPGSSAALNSVRHKLVTVQAAGFATKVDSVGRLDDSTLKRMLDANYVQQAKLDVRECSFILMTVLALTHGKCASRPRPLPPAPVVSSPAAT